MDSTQKRPHLRTAHKREIQTSTTDIQGYGWRWAGLAVLLGSLLFTFRFTKTAPLPPAVVVDVNEIRWNQMCRSITEMVGEYDGEIGIYIKDLKTGRAYERNADVPFLSASLIKLPIMVAAFQAVKDGKLDLNSKIKYKRTFRRGGSGRYKWARPGTTFPVSHLIYAMITQSDNTAAAMLINLLGYDYLNSTFARTGLNVTRINSTGMSLADRLHPSKDNFTTAREMGDLLEKIHNRQMVSDGLSDLMLEIMKGANSRTRLAAYLPANWQLARKTGLLRKNCHDVGIVFTPDGDYIICVLTGHVGNYRQAKGVIASVGREAYHYMGSS